MDVGHTQAEQSGLKGIYRENRGPLLRFVIARCGDAADAEDILQDLWLRLDTVASGPIDNGRAYLFRMAQNLVLDRLRERRRREQRDHHWTSATLAVDPRAGEVVDQTDDAERTLIKREDATRLARAIADLPPGAGQAFRLHKIEGLSQPEVAARLGISRSGVEKHMAVAMAHLRRALAED
uniref:RNA polymerase sigma factor n=1 Tax=uncultured Sphingomonas sp. TaxID=158754 RepID=UPI0035CACF06